MDSVIPEVKCLMEDVENFLIMVLKKEKLSRDTNKKRDELIKKITSLKKRMETEDRTAVTEDIYDEATSQETDTISQCVTENSTDDSKSVDDCPYGNISIVPLTPASELQPAAKEGMLGKKRKDGQFGLTKWQKRWCVVKDNIFYYYKKSTDKEQLNAFSLLGYEAKTASKKKKDFSFELSHSKERCFMFIAPSKDDMDDWIKCINNVVNKLENADAIATEDDETYDIPEVKVEEDDQDVYEIPQENVTPEPASKKVVIREEPKPIKPVIQEEIPEPKPLPVIERKKIGVMQTRNWKHDYVNIFVAMWDCKGAKDDELSFKRGEFIHIINKLEEFSSYKWWIGETKTDVGLVPSEYIMQAYEIS
ncbi:src kinase-associated phosphoprotein 2-B-like isoform X2 [Saccoglossus kowalevskii]